MAHEPIILDAESWTAAHAMVQYNLNRAVNNIHDERDRINGLWRKAEEHRCEQREADLRRIADRYDPLFSRMSSAETRAALYGAVGGFVASGLLSAVLMLLFKH